MNPNIKIESYHIGSSAEMIARFRERDAQIRQYLENYDTRGIEVEIGMACASNDEGGDVVIRVYTNEIGQKLLKERLDYQLEQFRGDL